MANYFNVKKYQLSNTNLVLVHFSLNIRDVFTGFHIPYALALPHATRERVLTVLRISALYCAGDSGNFHCPTLQQRYPLSSLSPSHDTYIRYTTAHIMMLFYILRCLAYKLLYLFAAIAILTLIFVIRYIFIDFIVKRFQQRVA